MKDSSMQQILEILPVVLFFIAYYLNGQTLTLGDHSLYFDGIYTATAVLMAATAVQLLLTLAISRKLEKRLVLLALVVFITGGLTIGLHNNIFILWKPTIFNWALAIAFIAAPFFAGNKTLIERMLGSQLTLPANIWQKMNKLWIANFLIVGALNLVVAYLFSESFWVSYKLYSSIIFTLLITVITAVLVAPYLKDQANTQGKD